MSNRSEFMNEAESALTLPDFGSEIISGMEDAATELWSSFVPETPADKMRLYNALCSGANPVAEHINEEILLKDVIITYSNIVSEETGEVSTVPRSSIIAVDGTIYTASSWGVYRALKRLMGVFGTLHFEEGLKLEFRRVKTKKGQTFNVVLK